MPDEERRPFEDAAKKAKDAPEALEVQATAVDENRVVSVNVVAEGADGVSELAFNMPRLRVLVGELY